MRQIDRYMLLCKERLLTPWRKEFQKEWNSLAMRSCNSSKYLVDHQRWICSCSYFATSWFFLCKHLVAMFGAKTRNFFRTVCQFKIMQYFNNNNVTNSFYKLDSAQFRISINYCHFKQSLASHMSGN